VAGTEEWTGKVSVKYKLHGMGYTAVKIRMCEEHLGQQPMYIALALPTIFKPGTYPTTSLSCLIY